MANAKKKTSTKKKSSTTKKKITSKSTATKATINAKTTSKTTSPKKTTSSKISTSAKSAKKPTIKVNIKEPIKVEEKIKLPNLKTSAKEISKNKNIAKKVIKSENYKVIKNEDNKEESKKVVGRKSKKKSKAKFISTLKKSDFFKKLSRLQRKIKMYGITSVIPLKYLITAIIAFITLIVAIVVCSNLFINSTKIDLESIPTKIDSLKTVSFNIDDVGDIIKSSAAFDSLKDYYEYDFKEIFNLDANHVEDYIIKYNKSKKQLFIVIKPTEGNEENIKKSIDKFLKDNKINDCVTLDYQGYIIYIKSKSEDSNKIVKSKIFQSQIRVFNPLRELKKDEINQILKISEGNYSENLVKTAMIIKSDVCGYVIFKPVNPSSKEKIKNAMEDYFAGLESKWNNNKENLELIKNRHFEEYQGYLIYIVSHNNDLVMDLIKN